MSQSEYSPEAELDQHYERLEIAFDYPGYWDVEDFDSPEEQAATVLTDNTAFWMASVIRHVEDVEHVIESALAAYEEEYDGIDVYERQDNALPGWIRQELEFHCQDLVNTVVLQARAGEDHVMLVLYQGQDRDLEDYRLIFDRMTGTLQTV